MTFYREAMQVFEANDESDRGGRSILLVMPEGQVDLSGQATSSAF
jgi:hypothetical protein